MKKLSVSIVCTALLITAVFVYFEALPVGAAGVKQFGDGLSTADVGTLSPVTLDREEAENTSAVEATTVSPAYEPPYGQSFVAKRWGLSAVHAPSAWAAGFAGGSAVVAVLDTGIDTEAPYLTDRVIREANFSEGATADDTYGHGTHMAGIIIAVAPEARLLNVKVADDRGNCDPSAVAAGIRWAATNGADVINLSLSTQKSTELEEAVKLATAKGALVVAAAGNGGSTEPSYPGYYEECLAVAALDPDRTLTILSNHGEWVDVAAPGLDIYSTLPDGRYGYKTGTSPAAAHVSGVAALAFAVAEDANDDGLLHDDVRRALESSCSSITLPHTDYGLVNALEAVTP
ncbi:MAG: S8 family serine peptidase [Chloroflexota bacterium]